jgi:hypothetical protein
LTRNSATRREAGTRRNDHSRASEHPLNVVTKIYDLRIRRHNEQIELVASERSQVAEVSGVAQSFMLILPESGEGRELPCSGRTHA